MQNNHMQHDIRRTRIYQKIYRPSSSIPRFLSTLLSVILHGQSQVGSPDSWFARKHR